MARKKKEATPLTKLEELAKALPAKQLEFCQQYLDDPRRDVVRAYMAVYKNTSKRNTAKTNAYKLLRLDSPTRNYIDECLSEARKNGFTKLRINEETILNEIAKMAFSNIKDYYDDYGQLKDLQDIPDEASAAIVKVRERILRSESDGNEQVVSREIELADKKGSLQLLGQSLAMFTQKVEQEHSGTVTVDFLNQLGEEMLDDLVSPIPMDNIK